jgi:hypothetical protein
MGTSGTAPATTARLGNTKRHTIENLPFDFSAICSRQTTAVLAAWSYDESYQPITA